MEWIKKNWMWAVVMLLALGYLFRKQLMAALGRKEFGDRSIDGALSTNNAIVENTAIRAGFIAPPQISIKVLDPDTGDFEYEMIYDRYRVQGVLSYNQAGPTITVPTNNGTFTARTILNEQAGSTQFVIIYPLYDNEAIPGYNPDFVKKAYFYIFSPIESYQNWKALNSKAAAVYDFLENKFERTK
jgi:hypothetical protein